MHQSQDVMAQAILYVPFHCGALSLRLHRLRVAAGYEFSYTEPVGLSHAVTYMGLALGLGLGLGQDYSQG